MPRFYFHLFNDEDVPDREGTDLPDADAAGAYASKLALFEAGEAVKRSGRIVLSHRIDIEDQEHCAVLTVWFRDVVQIEQ